MYNIDMYEYWEKPYLTNRKYGIHPLNDKGFEKYIGPESHNVNYLSRINPKVLKNIIGMDYETVTNQQKEKIKEMNEQREKENQETQQQPQASMKRPTPKKKVQIDVQDEERKGDELPPNENNEGVYDDTFNQNQTNFHKSSRPFTSLCSPTNGFRPYHKRRTFKENFGYEQFSTAKSNRERYQNEITDLKKNKLSCGEFNYSHSDFFYPKKRYNGFTSYAVPRTDKAGDNRNFSTAFKVYSGNINKSLSNFKNREGESEYEAMEKQNDEVKNNLFNQTSSAFRKRYKLPDILKIANTRQRIRNIRLGNSKEMGEKYNPYCHVLNTGDRIGRNYCGALFQH